MTLSQDTIVAQATPPGRGGVGIVRVSGPLAEVISKRLLSVKLKPREASYLDFKDYEGTVVDRGIALWFPGPHSFTGEDVLELQGHGGPVVMDLLIRSILACGARVARPGEFSERAFINDKLDLAQAEAIADLIDASSEQAARSAVRSLQGEFSRRVGELLEQLIRLRIYVEAAIDFPEEEIDFLSDGKIAAELEQVIDAIEQLQREALQGAILREGMRVVIAGKPNAGKSSLLNALAGRESAIVTEIPGTTRDVLREQIHIDGMPLHIIDTAGLRQSSDAVEKIGIERAWQEIEQADRVLLVVDATETDETDPEKLWPEYFAHQGRRAAVTLIRNKADLTGEPSRIHQNRVTRISLSAAQGDGVELLREHLKHCMGYDTHLEGGFIARRRHLDAIGRCYGHLLAGRTQLEARAGELLAEELTRAQQALAEITGEFTADDLLGRIFSSFCIGK